MHHTFTLQVSWGDGMVDQTNLPAGSTAFNANHTYLDDDADDLYIIFLTVTDDDGGPDTDQGVVIVHNVAPAVDAGADIMAAALLPVFFNGSFSDPGTADTHTIVWNFGDGTFAYDTLIPTHVYTQTGEYSVTLTVTDDEGGIGGDTLIVSVGDAPFRIWIPILLRED